MLSSLDFKLPRHLFGKTCHLNKYSPGSIWVDIKLPLRALGILLSAMSPCKTQMDMDKGTYEVPQKQISSSTYYV